MFTFAQTHIKDVVLISPASYADTRGNFFETYSQKEFFQAGIYDDFVQDNHSLSHYGVLRGLHFQSGEFAQSKLVRVAFGSVFDVAVDLRKDSNTYGKYFGTTLSCENKKMLYIPPFFAHGFLVLSPSAHFCYKCNNHYSKAHEGGFLYNSKSLDIQWPFAPAIVSQKDLMLPEFVF